MKKKFEIRILDELWAEREVKLTEYPMIVYEKELEILKLKGAMYE